MLIRTSVSKGNGQGVMEEEWLERYELVRGRLAEIKSELEPADMHCLYWLACVKLALGQSKEELRKEREEQVCFADYAVCRKLFGREMGKYYGLLFAQMLFIADFRTEKEELACICCELLVELYLIVKETEDKQAVRNTLYWFYSDYCEVFLLYFIERQKCGNRICIGGPMLFMEETKVLADSVWKVHETDYGLYTGNRFLERLYQAAGRIKQDECLLISKLLENQAKIQKNRILKKQDLAEGFSVTERQAEALERAAKRIAARVKDCSLESNKCNFTEEKHVR